MPLLVTGLGLVTSLGFGAAGSVAAIRGGLSRPEVLEGHAVSDGEDGEDPVTGFPASGYADGFYQSGAWVRLGSGALEDLLHRLPIPAASDPGWSRASAVALAPIVDEDRFLWSLEVVPRALEDAFATPILELAGVPIPPAATRGLGAGHVGLAEALTVAISESSAHRLERMLLVAADSYVDTSSLDWLSARDRLKSGERPTGLVPGEAGAALLVESEHAVRARKTQVLGVVEAVALAAAPLRAPPPAAEDDAAEDELPPLPPEGPKLGRAIAQAVRQVLPPGKDRFACDLYLDLNGEEWRAHGWGHAQVHLGRHLDLDRCRTFLPATSIGEVGAAAAPVALALALWNFDRDATRDALVISAADDGRVSAIRLSAAEAAPPAVAPRRS